MSVDKLKHSLYWCIGSCTLSGLCYYGYYRNNCFINILKNVLEFEVNEDLKSALTNAGGVLPYVAVRGTVHASNRTINGLYDKEAEGVIHRISVIEHKTEWNKFSNKWSDTTRTISAKSQQEEFHLTSGSDIKMHVKDLDDANNLVLSTTYDSYEPSNNILRGVLDVISGEHVKGIQTIEKMLLLGSKLLCIGEVKLMDNNNFAIFSPTQSGTKYLLVQKTLRDVIKSESSEVLKYLSMFFAVVGGVFGCYWLYKSYLQFMENRKFQSLLNENKQEGACTVCLDRPKDVVILPCGHVCTCRHCVLCVRNCPICRGAIDSTVPIFNS